jgi:Reverse transcriptase (RNA-dependent DNA polymerase)
MKEHCVGEGMDSVLVSLDAKKAFDSVSHQYIENTLKKYGFGPHFINCFRTLYNGISARILINGHLSRKMGIKRGVKQGDGFSGGIFAMCIDLLLRNKNTNPKIRMIELSSRLTNRSKMQSRWLCRLCTCCVQRGPRKSSRNL